MNPLNLPQYDIKMAVRNGKTVILDVLRRRFVRLTPEEWVRQHFINYLINYKGYPQALLANEIELSCGQKKLRCDSILYDTFAKPRMIIEYKAPNIAITQKTFDQITAYNILLKVDYLIISNGMKHYCCKTDYENHSYTFLRDIPSYDEISRHTVCR